MDGGHTLISGAADGAVRLWRLPVPLLLGVEAVREKAGQQALPVLVKTLQDTMYEGMITGHTAAVTSVAYSPDGHTLATGSADHTAIEWDMHHRQEASRLASWSQRTALARSGFLPGREHPGHGTFRRQRGSVRPHRRLRAPLALLRKHPAHRARLLPGRDASCRRFLGRKDDGTTALWDIADLRRPRRFASLVQSKAVFDVAFSPDGSLLAVAADETVHLWTVHGTEAPAERGASKPPRPPDSARHPAGRRQPARRTSPVGCLQPGPATADPHRLWGQDSIAALSLSPDGSTLAAISVDGTTTLWDVSNITGISQVEQTTCAIACPPLTRSEWARYAPGSPYRQVCGS